MGNLSRKQVSTALVMIVAVCGCGGSRRILPELKSAASAAIHDGEVVHVPKGPAVDLGELGASREELFQRRLEEVFGDENREQMTVVCRAKDLMKAFQATTAEEAVRSVEGALGVTPPPDELRELADATREALAADRSLDDVSNAAVTWACEWA
jgi:hypothetical protein